MVDQNRFKSYLLESLCEYSQRNVKIEERKQIIQMPRPQVHNIVQNPPRIMASRFSPLSLPAASYMKSHKIMLKELHCMMEREILQLNTC